MPFTNEEIRAKYEVTADTYEWREMLIQGLLGVRRLRRRLLRGARGKVLEVAAGTGVNLQYYPAHIQLTAVDLSPAMLAKAQTRAAQLGRSAEFLEMNAEHLAFPDRSFDTVVTTLSLCTFPDPTRALREIARVCHAEGRVLLLEHGRSSVQTIARWQDRTAERHAQLVGCYWNREPLEMVSAAGLRLVETSRHVFGVFHAIEAVPGAGASG